MSVLIKGMELPTTHEIVVHILPDGTASIHDISYTQTKETVAVELPKHGRLIDADALAEMHRTMAYEKGGRSYDFHITAKAWLDDAPTVIEGE